MSTSTIALRLSPLRTHLETLGAWARRGPVRAFVTKLVLSVAGVAVMLVGLAMLVLPGPGVVVMVAGLGLLAAEWEWARRLVRAAPGVRGFLAVRAFDASAHDDRESQRAEKGFAQDQREITSRIAARTAVRIGAGTAPPGMLLHIDTVRLSASQAPVHRGQAARCCSILTQVA